MKYQFLTAILFCSIAFSALALDDSKENREFQAKRYMASQPSEEMLKDMSKSMSMNLPPEQRKDFRVMILNYVDIAVIDEVSHRALVKYFTADELASLADYYSTPLAKSATKKMGSYMAELMPSIQAEFLQAFGEMEKVKAERNRALSDVDE